MFIHSSLYKKHFPFNNNSEIQQLNDRTREKLSKCIHKLPNMINYWKIDAAMNAAKGYLGSTCCLDVPAETLEKLRPEIDALADKVKKRHGLTEDEVLWANIALCAHKYNWFWSMYLHPAKDVAELVQKHKKTKGEGATPTNTQ